METTPINVICDKIVALPWSCIVAILARTPAGPLVSRELYGAAMEVYRACTAYRRLQPVYRALTARAVAAGTPAGTPGHQMFYSSGRLLRLEPAFAMFAYFCQHWAGRVYLSKRSVLHQPRSIYEYLQRATIVGGVICIHCRTKCHIITPYHVVNIKYDRKELYIYQHSIRLSCDRYRLRHLPRCRDGAPILADITVATITHPRNICTVPVADIETLLAELEPLQRPTQRVLQRMRSWLPAELIEQVLQWHPRAREVSHRLNRLVLAEAERYRDHFIRDVKPIRRSWSKPEQLLDQYAHFAIRGLNKIRLGIGVGRNWKYVSEYYDSLVIMTTIDILIINADAKLEIDWYPLVSNARGYRSKATVSYYIRPKRRLLWKKQWVLEMPGSDTIDGILQNLHLALTQAGPCETPQEYLSGKFIVKPGISFSI